VKQAINDRNRLKSQEGLINMSKLIKLFLLLLIANNVNADIVNNKWSVTGFNEFEVSEFSSLITTTTYRDNLNKLHFVNTYKMKNPDRRWFAPYIRCISDSGCFALHASENLRK